MSSLRMGRTKAGVLWGILALGVLMVVAAGVKVATASAVGSAFTYQGKLDKDASPASGDFDFQFSLWDSAAAGAQVGSTVTKTSVGVAEGLFTVALDFGSSPFSGDARWLQIAVRTAGSGSYTMLSPRQLLTAVPYALYGLTPGPHDHFGEEWTGSTLSWAAALKLTNQSTEDQVTALWGAVTSSSTGVAVMGENLLTGTTGSLGEPECGVYGEHIASYNRGDLGTAEYGVEGHHGISGPWGALGTASAGVYGCSAGGDWAGYFEGDVTVIGNLSKGSGSFKIDHPLDPGNKLLSHSFVESPDMMNVYNGNVLLDARGEASVELPEWFEALNMESRYQLTPIGAPGPNLYVAQEISHNRFKIAGGKPGMKVSWQVTGIRKDPYAQAHRIVVEEEKSVAERGFYLHPEAYGLPESQGIAWARKAGGTLTAQQQR